MSYTAFILLMLVCGALGIAMGVSLGLFAIRKGWWR